MIDGSLAIRKNIEVNNMLVVPAQEGAVTREVTEYVVRQDDLAKDYEDAFKDVLKLPGSKGEGEGVAQMIRAVQAGVKCTPYLFDEVSSKSFGTSIKKEVKNADFCERNGRQQQPVIVFTSNDMSDPDDAVRKRSIHLFCSGGLYHCRFSHSPEKVLLVQLLRKCRRQERRRGTASRKGRKWWRSGKSRFTGKWIPCFPQRRAEAKSVS